ncbi:aminoglycoside phosphotransferase (APT) family kinase protein [Isoptericola sp. CG 20/1183]|uniref:Aminoglycoside phosphotransferase (APT) family kinase protein n=1 Tax=Isoptericola halotolerans TaxID=300560 RepID=A0ABX5EER5_9MICO|nr:MULTISPECIES: aminoglycoside phosphotransferase family protein [Isoptericola]MCK0115617.1 aminoglycoside phosphotransferase family protein [Isoptericola sp. S6320L]PRZ03821.1 aminoglycoside phosphotransferase (APT) family kinase protein [Isoptericola sp. CG 20/1183]PRZ04046.1 aminoglycoside phosphotransferase (APT) family kinase protein [Isoptericola halotolerans]
MKADLDVTVDLVRGLLAEQHPDLADRTLRVVANGWDNVMLRLGDDLAVRVPCREVAAHLVEHEQQWLPVLAPRLPVVVPVAVRVGRPSPALDYPWSWSVVPWTAGVRAADVPVGRRRRIARPLAAFHRALHVPAPSDAPVNPFRNAPLPTRGTALRGRVERGVVPDGEKVLALWARLVDAPPWGDPPVWIHGDPHPGNLVLTDAGTGGERDALAAVVDFGDMTSGDPATDLAAGWLVLDAEGRAAYRDALADRYPQDDPVWLRARGWALNMSTSMLESGPENAWVRRMGEESLARVLDDT